MAKVEDAPPELRALARKIPPDVREHLGAAELRFRVERAAALLDEAVYADDREARHLRDDADRYLEAASFTAYLAMGSALTGLIREAHERGDTRAEWELTERLADFTRRNPQVLVEMAGNGEDITVAVNEINGAAPRRRRWGRNHRFRTTDRKAGVFRSLWRNRNAR